MYHRRMRRILLAVAVSVAIVTGCGETKVSTVAPAAGGQVGPAPTGSPAKPANPDLDLLDAVNMSFDTDRSMKVYEHAVAHCMKSQGQKYIARTRDQKEGRSPDPNAAIAADIPNNPAWSLALYGFVDVDKPERPAAGCDLVGLQASKIGNRFPEIMVEYNARQPKSEADGKILAYELLTRQGAEAKAWHKQAKDLEDEA
jgi:hypothetical protein